MRASLGAVDYEKGFQWSMSSYNNYVAETLFPRISQSLILVYHYWLNTHLFGLDHRLGFHFHQEKSHWEILLCGFGKIGLTIIQQEIS